MKIHLSNLEISTHLWRSKSEKRYSCHDFVTAYICSSRVTEQVKAQATITKKTHIVAWPECGTLLVCSDQTVTHVTGLGELTEAEWRNRGVVVNFSERLAWLGCPPWISPKIYSIGEIGMDGIKSCFLCLESEARYLLEQYLADAFTGDTDRCEHEIKE